MTCENPLSANLSQDPAPGVVPSTSNPGNGSTGDGGQAPEANPPRRRRTNRGVRGKRRRPAPATNPIPTEALTALRLAYEQRRS